jgi:predicted CopG family antitoxin
VEEFEDFIKKATELAKAKRGQVLEIIAPYLSNLDLTQRGGIRKRKELIDLIKFITTCDKNINILSGQFEKPDFIVRFEEELYGLEHTEVIDEVKKRQFEFNQSFVKRVEEHFIKKYGDVKMHINISFKNDIVEIDSSIKKKLRLSINQSTGKLASDALFQLAYPGYLTKLEFNCFAKNISDKIHDALVNHYEYFEVNDFINYVMFHPAKDTSINRNFSYGADSLSNIILNLISEKEGKIDVYKANTNGIKQCLFLVIQGGNGYSDYASFDEKILQSRGSKFDKVIAFNFFKEEIFYLK